MKNPNIVRAAVLLLMLGASSAWAQTSVTEPESRADTVSDTTGALPESGESAADESTVWDQFRARGYLWAEMRHMHFDSASALGQIAATRLPQGQGYFEANADLRWTPWDVASASLDLSTLYLTDTGARLWLRESYLEANPDAFRFLVGKSRVTYSLSAGLSPADLLNPPRDPAQPEIQAEGSWMALAQYARDRWALSAIFSPQVATDAYGLPQFAMLESDAFRAALRGYLNVAEMDINLITYWINHSSRSQCCLAYSASAARVIADTFELHGEATVARYEAFEALGSGQSFTLPSGMPQTGIPAPVRQSMGRVAGLRPTRPQAHDWQAVGLLGGRYMSNSNQVFVAEYYFNTLGLTPAEKKSVAEMAGILQRTDSQYPELGLLDRLNPASMRNRDGFVGRHILIASWMWNELLDYYTPRIVWQQALDDGSFTAFVSVDDRLADSVLATLGAAVPYGAADTEFGMLGLDWRLFARLTYNF